MTASRILIIEDEESVRNLLERVLVEAGFKVTSAGKGLEGLALARQLKPDLLILDLNLPDISGEELCLAIRKDFSIQALAIIILTGRNSEGLPAKCLDIGADDYLAKPFDIKELAARVRAVLRRPRIYATDDTVIVKGNLTIRVAEHKVLIDERLIADLAPKEFELLHQLVLHSPKVVNKDNLALKVWGVPAQQLHDRTLDVHARRIRVKLGPQSAQCLKTIPSIGWQWLENPPSGARTLRR